MTEPYATHLPVLRRSLELTNGPILECGGGDYSTPLVHEFALNRVAVTVDTEPQWLPEFPSRKSSKHIYRACDLDDAEIPNWNEVDYGEHKWSVVFVDQSPAAGRLVTIAAVMDNAEFIVVHDTEYSGYHYEPLLRQFKYRYDYKDLVPWTTVVSNVREFTMG